MKALHQLLLTCLIFTFLTGLSAQTFNGIGNLPVPPGAPGSTVGVTTSTATVTGVGVLGGCSGVESVTIDFTHTWVGDVAIFLISPSGSILELTSGNGGSGNNFQVTTFTDTAPIFITDGAPPYNGSFRPEGRQTDLNCFCSNANVLGTFTFTNTFAGENADGDWELYINDYVALDVGQLNSWSITFSNNGSTPTANPAALSACLESGSATVDLTSVNSTINGGAGVTILWFENMAATIPILSPTSYGVTGTTTVYAVVDTGGCQSAPVPVTITTEVAPDANPASITACGDGSGQATFDLTTLYNTINNGTGLPVNFFPTPVPINPIAPSSYVSSGGTIFAIVLGGLCNSAPVPITLTVTPAPDLTLNQSPFICEGQSFDLSTVVSTSTGLPITYHSGTPPTGGNQLPGPVVSPSVTTVYYAFIDAGGGCTAALPIQTFVTPSAPPILGTTQLCVNDPFFDLSNLLDPAFPTGVWTGPGVSGGFFDPSGQSGTVVLSFDPDDPCGQVGTTNITVVNAPAPPLSETLVSCDDGTGQAIFDLTSIEGIISGGTDPVNWFVDPAATIPITNPGTYLSPLATVYATIGVGACQSAATPIDLFFLPALNASNTTLTISPLSGCGPTPVDIQINVPSPGDYLVNFGFGNPLTSPPFTTGASVGFGPDGTILPFLVSENTLFQVQSAISSFNGVTCFYDIDSDDQILVTVEGPPLLVLQNPSICQGEITNLADVVDNPLNAPLTFHSETPTTVANQLPSSVVTPNTSTVYYVQADNGAGCATELPIIVTVDPPDIPVLGTSDVCETETSFDLSALTDPGFPNGVWSGPGVNGNFFSAAGQNGTVQVTYTPIQDCSQPSSTTLNIVTSVSPQLTASTICESDLSFPLVNLQDPNFPVGTWSGPGVIGNSFQPTGLSGQITLTFDPDVPCATPTTTIIEVEQEAQPVLTSANICGSAGSTLDLNTLIDIAYPTGTWSGPGVVGNQFSPFGLSGAISLSFQSDESCVAAATTTVTIDAPLIPQLGTETVCVSETSFDLTNLLDPAFPNGSWSGPGVNGNSLDATGLSGLVLITFTSTDPCTEPAVTDIEITDLVSPSLLSTTICEEGDPLDLSTLLDPTFPLGTWTGPGVSGDVFSPSGQTGLVTLTFTPDDLCSQSATTDLEVNETPSIEDIIVDCTSLNDAFNVSFSITGGDASSYTVNGQSSTANFVSAPILSGESYDFVVEDGNVCGTAILNGSFDCACTTFAGTIDLTNSPFFICADDIFTAIANPDDNLDPTDIRLFVLHDAPSTVLGNILATNTVPEFGFPVGGTLGTTYYVSAVAANDDGTGNFDSSDACFSVSAGVPVIFYEPTVTLDSGGSICASDCFEIPVSFTGIGPFELSYQISNANGISQEIFNTADDNATLEICPADLGLPTGQTTIEALTINDANGCSTSLSSLAAITIDVLAEPQTNISSTLCEGETLTVGTTVFSQAFPSATVVLENAAVNGCDSTVQVNLQFNPIDTTTLAPTLCSGASLSVGGTVYDELNPSGVEILTAVSNCDSIVVIALNFTEQIVFDLTETLCPDEEVMVNGVLYNAANPVGSETITNGSVNGCDSVINVNLSFFPAATGEIIETLCPGESLVINGITYDEANPTGTEILSNASLNGCDSVVNINLSFFPVAMGQIMEILCPGESILVNGISYDEANPAGTEILPGASVNGCDSVVNVNLSFFPVATGQIIETLCPGESLQINGITYDEANPVGTEILLGASLNGCDSTVNINLSFFPVATGQIMETLCPGESLIVNGTSYDESNPAGTEILPGASLNGCDSVINVNLSFFPLATGQITETLCPGESILVNGTTYDEANPTGTEILLGASINGCDSTVSVVLNFLEDVTEDLAITLCEGESIDLNDEVYDENNPSGQQNFPGGSSLGCDSTLNITLNFLPIATSDLIDTLFVGESITVNGNTYNEANPSGVEVLENAAANGCDSLINIDLFFIDLPILTVSAMAIPPSCESDSDGQIVIENITGGDGTYEVRINEQSPISITNFPFILPALAAGNYEIIINDGMGLVTSLSFLIQEPAPVLIELTELIELELGENVLLNAQTNIDPTSIVWTPTDNLDCIDCLNPTVIRPTENLEYSLTIMDENGCTATSSVQLQIDKRREVYVPNAFSPNGDGINDRAMIFAGNDVVNINSFQIYDRWGNAVFEDTDLAPNNISLGWDGRYRGQDMNSAVFIYFAEIEFLDGEVEILKGEILLVR